ncbi:Uma2 family endonuclease [soil metagenome]
MTMADATILHRGLTWQEFLDLPDDDRYRHAELINGEVVVTAASPLHQQIANRLWARIDAWTREGPGGGEATTEPGVQITEHRGYLPDVAWYRHDKCAPAGEPPAFVQPPDLAVEVLSPSTRSLDAIRKRNDYAAIGVTELWLIDPDRPEARILRPADAVADVFVDAETDIGPDGVLSSPLLPGFTVRLGDLVERHPSPSPVGGLASVGG